MIILVKPCVRPEDNLKVDYHDQNGGCWYRAINVAGQLCFEATGGEEEVGGFITLVMLGEGMQVGNEFSLTLVPA
jgi:hypothetical protein